MTLTRNQKIKLWISVFLTSISILIIIFIHLSSFFVTPDSLVKEEGFCSWSTQGIEELILYTLAFIFWAPGFLIFVTNIMSKQIVFNTKTSKYLVLANFVIVGQLIFVYVFEPYKCMNIDSLL